MDEISYLTLAETIQWMETSVENGVDVTTEEFWSNFMDALMYLRCYGDMLNCMMKIREDKKNGRHKN